MADPDFQPYWQPLEPGRGPNSWIFFVLANIDGRHRPLAAASSTGAWAEEESLHADRLVACLRRIVTVLSDPTNRTAISSEMALAASYFAAGHGDGVSDDNAGHGLNLRRPEPVQLPELNRRAPGQGQRRRPWDRESVPPFPFITAALLLGVGSDPPPGYDGVNRPEPLATVYRDPDVEWGMVVVDVTDLILSGVLRYGIVGFKIGEARWIDSRRALMDLRREYGGFDLPTGPLAVLEAVRPRRAMSAVDYMAKFDWGGDVIGEAYILNLGVHNRNMELLASLSVVEDAALDMVWPKEYGDGHPPVPDTPLSAEGQRDLKYQAIGRLIQETQNMDDLDVTILNEVRDLPGFTDSLRHNMLQNPDRIGNTRAAGRLLRLAFVQNGHLGLEGLKNVPAQGIWAALDDGPQTGVPQTDGPITSLSLCLDCVRGTPAQLAHSLSQAPDTLREVCLLQSPSRDTGALGAQVFIELAARPPILSRIKVTFAGAYSAALRKRFWLPTSSNHTPLDIFPVQQIFVRHYNTTNSEYDTLYCGDGLLKPERFAAGFLAWLSGLEWGRDGYYESEGNHASFGFSSAPASLTADPVSSASVSPIMCENMSLPRGFSTGQEPWCSPRARDLDPGGWTVLVSQGGNPPTPSGQKHPQHYAFVRARGQPISVKDPPTATLGPERLDVVGLEGFLAATASYVNLWVLDARLDAIRSTPVMGQVEAATILLECLDAARYSHPIFRLPDPHVTMETNAALEY
ncbi:uncharacterized protein PG998_004977 [Apiospora kogelbergensis]|uniref:uncharacterized protein n=1 Tax=Apiospora kogelbergensis TaxID=1337665 RepID=UPI003131E603